MKPAASCIGIAHVRIAHVTCDVQRCNGQVMADTELTQVAGRHHHAILCVVTCSATRVTRVECC